MKFGLFGGAKSGGDASADSQSYRRFIDYVLAAEELGYQSLFVVEHHFTGVSQVSASLNLLSYLAGRTSRMRLGTAVVVLPWHNPVLLAEQVATLDLLSGGRHYFKGVGILVLIAASFTIGYTVGFIHDLVSGDDDEGEQRAPELAERRVAGQVVGRHKVDRARREQPHPVELTAAQQHLREARDAGEGRVDLVRHARGEEADRRHLLGDLELLFELDPRRDVLDDDDVTALQP